MDVECCKYIFLRSFKYFYFINCFSVLFLIKSWLQIMKRKHICYRSIFWVQVFLCFESIFLLHDTYEWFKFVYMGERCCEWSTDLFVVRRSPASVVHSEIYLWCWSSVHVFFIVYYRYTNKLFNRDSERTDLFVLWYVLQCRINRPFRN